MRYKIFIIPGLFSYSHLDFEVDRDNSPDGDPSLANMTRKAIEILQKNPHGFFLFIEGKSLDLAILLFPLTYIRGARRTSTHFRDGAEWFYDWILPLPVAAAYVGMGCRTFVLRAPELPTAYAWLVLPMTFYWRRKRRKFEVSANFWITRQNVTCWQKKISPLIYYNMHYVKNILWASPFSFIYFQISKTAILSSFFCIRFLVVLNVE